MSTYKEASTTRPLTPGVYAPIPTFFLPGSQDLGEYPFFHPPLYSVEMKFQSLTSLPAHDLFIPPAIYSHSDGGLDPSRIPRISHTDIPTFQKHIVRIATANVGILICGSMGEAHHLTPDERLQLIHAARNALDGANFTTVPIIVGTGVGSTRETIRLTKNAAEAGADYAIVIPSGYYASSFDRKAIKGFFQDVAEASPIPVMIYNFPGAAGGIDMDSDLIEEMAMDIPNLCGVKLTCGNVGKLTRVAATVGRQTFGSKYPRKNKDAPFLVLGGLVDFLLPSTFAGAHGAITGLANLYPLTIRALWDKCVSYLPSATASSGFRFEGAMEIQGIVAHADRTIALTGIAGTKWLMQHHFGYGGVCRLPLQPLDDATGELLKAHPHIVAMDGMEKIIQGDIDIAAIF